MPENTVLKVMPLQMIPYALSGPIFSPNRKVPVVLNHPIEAEFPEYVRVPFGDLVVLAPRLC